MNNYGPVARMLHRLALGNRAVAEMTFDIEWATQGRKAPAADDGQHVFVTGLARAGTTQILRVLYGTSAFASLTYRAMPFVLAPNLWGKVAGSRTRKTEPRERFHGDGILVDLDFPEAFEEVFWRTFAGNEYIGDNALTPHRPDRDTLDQFARHMSTVMLANGGERYLSKNNNNILRLPALAERFPAATIVVPFRDPLQHAASLLAQHRRFLASQADDPFIRDYMTWLVHREFGEEHLPFRFGSDPITGDPQTIDYWLARWIDYHAYLLNGKLDPSRMLLVPFERLCAEPDQTWAALAKRLAITPPTKYAEPYTPTGHKQIDASAKLVDEARVLHGTLETLSDIP